MSDQEREDLFDDAEINAMLHSEGHPEYPIWEADGTPRVAHATTFTATSSDEGSGSNWWSGWGETPGSTGRRTAPKFHHTATNWWGKR